MLARLTTAMLMLYFTLAVSFHIKAGANGCNRWHGSGIDGCLRGDDSTTPQASSHWWMQARDLTRSTSLDESSRAGSLDSPGLRSKPNGKLRNASN